MKHRKNYRPNRVWATVLRVAMLVCFTGYSVAPAFAAPANVGPANVTSYAAGWVDARTVVHLDVPQINPDNCPQPGYLTNETMGGGQLFNSVLLTAFSTNRRVTLTIDGCYLGWPQIIGVVVHQ